MNSIPAIDSLLPQYETVLPFSKQTAVFTPFRVKDAKNISIILQEEDKVSAFRSMVNLLISNTRDIDINELCLADAEFLFLQIRGKSVDERLNLVYKDQKIQVFISEIKPRNTIVTESIAISNDLHLTLETPKIKDLLKLKSYDKNDLVKLCIKKLVIKNEIYNTSKYLPDELHQLIDNLPISVMTKIDEFLLKQPELYLNLPTDDGEQEVSGFLRFFTYR